ncbi:hypothetical protein V6N12_048851 [Hibiscus sabdariffa]|uniref:Uncharacterized protein n=1 Tax=Hibiscus sabdariffa TaxID=183260 RepID=A0ABR2EIG7_9ROSI
MSCVIVKLLSLTWFPIPLIRKDPFHEFLSMNIANWIFLQLGSSTELGIGIFHIYFGIVFWNLWKRRNEVSFDEDFDATESVHELSLRLCQEEACFESLRYVCGCMALHDRWTMHMVEEAKAWGVLDGLQSPACLDSVCDHC